MAAAPGEAAHAKPRFFLSYRRDDSAGFAGRLSDGLEVVFGAGSVFRDVDDIRPGQDFADAINAQLKAARAVLVMIGPRWLAAEADGRRRLDAADDFVRREVAAGLASGKPVIPLLVGGATMPEAGALPGAIAALARYQAVVLSDVDWHADLERLVARLHDLGGDDVPERGRRGLLLAAAAVAAVAIYGGRRLLPSLHDNSARRALAAAVVGRWQATVTYDWGDRHDEVFEFADEAGAVHGTATFEGGRLAIEQATLDGGWLSFATRSLESLNGGESKEVVHRYRGHLERDGMRFTLEITGGYSVHTPVTFVARRAGA
jgi:hypothetical protein